MIVISAQAFPPKSGGIENLMAGLAQYCVAAGHEVVVLADGRGRDDARPYRVQRFGGPKPLRRWRKARRLRALVAAGGVEAVYACSWKSVEALRRRLPVPVVAYAHGNEFKQDKADRIRRALGSTSDVIFVSRETRDRALTMLPPGIGTHVIHPPVHPHPPATQADRAWAEDQFQISAHKLLSLGRLIAWKGQDQAIRAVAAMRLEWTDIRLVIAGSGADEARLRKLAKDLGVEANVAFCGRVEGGRKTALLEDATLFVQAGRREGDQREGFGITYLEAALAGLPTISGRDGGAPEAVVDGVTGHVVDGRDTDAVIGAIRALLIDDETTERFAHAARQHGEAALWNKMIGPILAVAGLQDRRQVQTSERDESPSIGKGASNGQT